MTKLIKTVYSLSLQVNGEILLCGYNTRNGNHASDKPESDIESLLDNGQGKRIISSSSSHLQNDEKRVTTPCQILLNLNFINYYWYT